MLILLQLGLGLGALLGGVSVVHAKKETKKKQAAENEGNEFLQGYGSIQSVEAERNKSLQLVETKQNESLQSVETKQNESLQSVKSKKNESEHSSSSETLENDSQRSANTEENHTRPHGLPFKMPAWK